MKTKLLIVALLCSFFSWAQVWTYDFGTSTGVHPTASVSTTFLTGTPAGGGTYRVRTGSGAGVITLANPGTTLGTGSELQIQSSTTTSTNKFAVYDWSTPTTVAYIKTKIRTTSATTGNLNLSFGLNTTGSDNNGYTNHYNNSVASMTITYTVGAITSIVRRISGANTAITGSGLAKDSDQAIEIYVNNGAAATNYEVAATSYTLNSQQWDLWVGGTKISPAGGWPRAGTIAASTNITGFAFFAESSTTNSAVYYIDDLEYSNTLPTSCVAPSVTTNPSTGAQNVCQGSSATALSVVASGSSLTYQWYSNAIASNAGGTLIPAATSASYTPPSSSLGTTYYYCVVSGACGSPATSNVSGAITVTALPADPTGSITASANPSCGPATLSYPTGYYWQTTATGTSIANPTSSTYTLNATGTVYVRSFNGTCWSANSLSSGVITINTPISITTQPVNSTIYSGSNTSFTVAATGTGLTYQWQVDTGTGFVNLSNIAPYSNVTTATMNITSASVSMNGYLYRCVVSGASPCSSVNSNAALLTVNLYVPTGTVFKPGDLVFIGYDSTANSVCAGADDKYYIANLVDILPGTQFLVVNSRYESGAAANVRTDRWYSGGSAPYDDPGVITFTWNGLTAISKGSIISFKADALIVSEISVNNVLEPALTYTTNLNQCNISSSDPDQIYLMQGLFSPFGVVGTTRYNTFTGRVLYGITNGVSWVPFTSAVSAGTTGGATRESRLPDDIECFNIESTSLNGVRFFNNSALHTGTKYQILSALINTGNWTIPVNTNCLNVTEDYTGVTGVAIGKPFVISAGNIDGTWTGAVDTDWFKCANWEGLTVPKATDDVIIPVVVNQPIIGASPTKFSNGAYSNNLTIDAGSSLSMPNALSRLNLYGNWNNNAGNVGFAEGLGTVYFEGSTPQIINNVTPEGTETFHNLILNNNFTTNVSNDIIANGDLTINATKTLTVSSGDYAQVTNNVTNNGTFTIENTGSLIQINDLGVNTGALTMKRTASQRLSDYVYWSSPVANFGLSYFTTTGGTPAANIFQWGATTSNPNGGEGYWSVASGNMTSGKGYIVRGSSAFSNAAATSWDANFTGVANNGIVTIPIARGNDYTGLGTQGIMRTSNDDNWNLIGNPYPSAIGVNEFLSNNASIDGFVKIWTHGNLPTSIVDPFYQDFVLNYFATDYTTINSTGLTSGPGDYKIGAGQGFFVSMVAGLPGSSTVTFNNAMRSRTYANNQFYRTANENQNTAPIVEKNRIWLDLISPLRTVTRTLVGYVDGATNQRDRLFDAITDYKNAQNFYSLLDTDIMSIQGKAIPFEVNDQIPLGMKVPTNGTYTIAIAAVDGLFSNNNQKIFLEDKVLQTIHEISALPYTFTTNSGMINDRFVLRYTNPALSTNDPEMNDSVSIYNASNSIKIVSTLKNIKNVSVYNVLGQNLASKITDQKEVIITSIPKANQALVVKVTLENDQVITKKLVY